MARKITTRVTGAPLLGSLFTTTNTVKTLATDENLLLDPNGAGLVNVIGYIKTSGPASGLQLEDGDASNKVTISVPDLNSDYTLTLPTTDGDSNQVLQTNGSGTLSWADLGVTITDDTTTNATRYVHFSSATSGNISTLNASSTKLRFNPSTGSLFSSVVTGGTAASNNLVLRSTSDGTKGQVYLDEATASSSTTSGALRLAGGAGIAGSVYVGGTLSASNITETSSIALKTNVTPIESALDKLTQLVGVTYDRKDGSTKNEAGLIAEEVHKVLPNLVTYRDGKPEGINYTKISAYIIEAIKEIKEEVRNLKGF